MAVGVRRLEEGLGIGVLFGRLGFLGYCEGGGLVVWGWAALGEAVGLGADTCVRVLVARFLRVLRKLNVIIFIAFQLRL